MVRTFNISCVNPAGNGYYCLMNWYLTFIKIGKAAEILGVSVQTLRRWEATEVLVPARKIRGTRYYDHDAPVSPKLLY